MWIRTGLIVALLAAGCSAREDQAVKAAPVAKAGPVAKAVAVEDIAALHATMDEREDAGAMAEAAAAGDKLVARLRERKLTGDPSYADTLEAYGRVVLAAGRWGDVEPILQEAMALPRGKTDPVLRAALLFELGGLYSVERRNEEAITALLESLELTEKAHGPDSVAASNTAESLAAAYDYVGRYVEAEALFRRSLELVEKHHGASSAQLGRVLSNLALNLSYQKRLDDAFTMYQRAIPMLEPLQGYDRAALAAVHGGLGHIHRERDELKLSEASYRRALTVREEALGPEHPLVAMDNYNLAIVFEDQNKLEAAVEACGKAEALRAKALAADHPHRLQTEDACARMRAALARPLRKMPKRRSQRSAR